MSSYNERLNQSFEDYENKNIWIRSFIKIYYNDTYKIKFKKLKGLTKPKFNSRRELNEYLKSIGVLSEQNKSMDKTQILSRDNFKLLLSKINEIIYPNLKIDDDIDFIDFQISEYNHVM